MLTSAFYIQPAEGAWTGTIYIRVDGSIDPADAPVITYDNITYILTDDIMSNENGIVVERDNIIIDGKGYTIQGTCVRKTAYRFKGVDLSNRRNVTVTNIKITNFRWGIYLLHSSGNRINGNIIAHNWEQGIYLCCSSNNSISGNIFLNDGLFAAYSYGNIVVSNLVNGKPLVYLEKVSSYVVEEAGQVVLINCTGIRVENLNLSNTCVAVELWAAWNCTISGNNITANNLGGIHLGFSSGNRISGNIIASNFLDGVYVWYSSNNNISGNTITSNGRYGVYLYCSSNNRVYHNNFINDTGKIHGFNSINIWDDGYPSGGNYWSDYTGTDFYSGPFQNETGSDGIGDTPYIIDENNKDRYPLVEPWQPHLPKKYTLYVESSPITGLPISYSGDHVGSSTTNFTIGPKNSPFTVTLTAPLTYESYQFSYWLLDGVNIGEDNSITVKVNDDNSNRTVIAIFVPRTTEPDFSISISPRKVTISPGESASYTVMLTSMNGFSSSIVLTGSITPNTDDVSISFNPETVTPPTDGSTTSTVIVSTTPAVSPQTYVLAISASGDGKMHSVNVILEIIGTSTEISLIGPLDGITIFNFTYKDGNVEKVWNPHLMVKVTKNGEPVQGVSVEFYIDGEKVGDSLSDDKGIAVCIYEKPVVGWHTWYATANSYRSETWRFEFRKPHEPSLAELLIDSIARFKLSSTEWASISITKYHFKVWDSLGEQYWGGVGDIEVKPAEIGGDKPEITLLINSKYILYLSLYKVTPSFGSTRTIIISIPKSFEIYDYNKKKWLSLSNVKENGPWSLNLVKSNVPPDLETPCRLIVKNKLWDHIRGLLWAKYGSAVGTPSGRRVHDRWGTDTVDFLQFLMDGNVLVGDQNLTEWADVSLVHAAFIDEDSTYAYYVLVVDAPNALEQIYLSLPIRPAKEESVKINMFKSLTISDKLAQVQQIIKLLITATEFTHALATAQNWYSIVAAIGTKGHSLYTEFTNLADLEKASHDSINIAITNSFIEAKAACEVRILLIDPDGRKVGFDANEGNELNEVPNASYSGIDSYPQIVVIRNPLKGDYRVVISAVNPGSYLLELSYHSAEGVSHFANITSSINRGEIQHYVLKLTKEGKIDVSPYSPTPLHLYFIAIVIMICSALILILYRQKRRKQ